MSIAVAHSDTPEGRAALLAASAWAETHDTDLLVLHVEGDTASETTRPEARQSGVHEVERAVTDTFQQHGAHPVDWSVVATPSGGDVASALLDLVVEHAAELLVVGSQRRSRVGKLLMGSTVQRVVLDSPVPVLVVRAG
ncbi:universal stress protein [Ornithinicoccus hortensis]|uniref:Nucleotide-binding universal stress UspA family protein n=1 Tax=Ornithinicoccus hortensis TaxID=82346 RepID=A0A542YMK3_9MICO|nr:universal stress protein [Ornithinicoccus hortensis]TQL49281.1 nucleotide-binding universal stress UspA family protein [Ornithinicoccus hortensis]